MSFEEILKEAREIKITKNLMKRVKQKDLIRDYKGLKKPKKPSGFTVLTLPNGKQVYVKKKEGAVVKMNQDGKPVYHIDRQENVQRSRRMKRIAKRTAFIRARHAKLTKQKNKGLQ